ncbi:MAG: glycosyltransferase family 4 protein [Clostridiales bacterium]|mgnify:CR=1 FL=1|jgi:1,2-diacylglycerol 3-alpha-glucosyltransferase|nr:glycosyltransferase family 4 protein [Clostridiales bacterium]
MNVALFVDVYYPFINGVVTHVAMLRDSLQKRGHNVLIVTADPRLRHHTVRDGILYCPAIGIKKIYGFGLASPISKHRMSAIAEFKPDIIHVHDEFPVAVFGAYAAKKLNVPLVYTLHTMYDEYFHYAVSRRMIPIAKQTFYRYINIFANRADVIISPSAKAIDFFRECKVTKPVEIIPNSIDTDKFNPDKFSYETVRKKRAILGISEGDLAGIFVGRLGKEKSVDYLIETWAEEFRDEPRFKLIVVGDGPERPALEKLAGSLGVTDKVIFVGKVDHADIPLYFAASDYYVTASLTEMMSISMLEGMSMGLPAVIRFDPVNKQQVQDGVNGFIYHDKKQFAEIVRRLAQYTPTQLDDFHRRVREATLTASSDRNVDKILLQYEKAKEIHAARQGKEKRERKIFRFKTKVGK